MVYVLNVNGQPLMPTNRHGHVRKLLKAKRAKVVKTSPFTIQLLYGTADKTQPVDLKVDAGYMNIGISACSDKAELYSGEIYLLENMKQRLEERRKYRRTRRNKLRYRKPRFHNRRRSDGWLAPSIEHKLNSHIKAIDSITKMLPVTKIYVEVANFDIQKIKNPDIEGTDYQQGDLLGFNLREYVFYRDGYKCQFCGANAFKDGAILRMHHLEYWNNNNRSNTPANCTTACTKCHCSKNHEPGGLFWGLKAKQKQFKPETFMSTVRWFIINRLSEQYTIPVVAAFGYLTKTRRIELKLPKTHYNDAFCIGDKQPALRLADTLFYKQKRKNNRSLQLFYDAKYIDSRDGKQKSGKELYSGRSTRNKLLNAENLHVYRQQKVKKGSVSTRKRHYKYQPNDLVWCNNTRYVVVGTHCNGSRVMAKDAAGIKKSFGIKSIENHQYIKTTYLERCERKKNRVA